MNMNDLRLGDILLEHCASFWRGGIIQKILDEPYCHALIYTGKDLYGHYITDAQWYGVTVRKFYPYKEDKYTVMRPKFEFDEQVLLQNISDCVGTGYDYTGVIYHGFLRMAQKMGYFSHHKRVIRSPLENPGRLFCFEHVVTAWHPYQVVDVDSSCTVGTDFLRSPALEVAQSDFTRDELNDQKRLAAIKWQ